MIKHKLLGLFVLSLLLIGMASAACVEDSTKKICTNSDGKKTLDIYSPRYYDSGILGFGGSWKKANGNIQSCLTLGLLCDHKITTLPYQVEIKKNNIKITYQNEVFSLDVDGKLEKVIGNKVYYTLQQAKASGQIIYEFNASKINKYINLTYNKNDDFSYIESYSDIGGSNFDINNTITILGNNGIYRESNLIRGVNTAQIYLNSSDLEGLTYPILIDPSLNIVSGTTTLSGVQSYDYVYLENGATLAVDGAVGWLNLSANQYMDLRGTISVNSPNGGGASQGSCTALAPGAGGSGPNPGSGGTVSQAFHTCTATGGTGGTQSAGTNDKTVVQGSGGGSGGAAWWGSAPSSSCPSQKVFSGGGGGGAGAIVLNSNVIYFNGTLNANGGSGGSASGRITYTCGGGGSGGSGGTVLLLGGVINISKATFNVAGGGGGSHVFGGGDGQSGAGGRVKAFYKYSLDNSTTALSLGSGTYFSTQDINMTFNHIPLCTPPAINTNWNVLWSDNCTLSTNTNLGTGNLTLYGNVTGYFTLNANLTIHNENRVGISGVKFVQLPGSKLIQI